ncbi:MAG: hypothetical protein NT091_04560 [Candidatus Falkowbacteria bacterium]|nr:hypothetical protein [Candidatus Falkowbacteria bacterium]
MDNFVLGVDSLLNNLSLTIKSAAGLPIFWGFFIGFIVAILMQAFLISGNPKKIHMILFNDKSASFEKIYKKNGNIYHDSYSTYAEIVQSTKFIFSLILLFFILIILLVLIIF